MTSLHWTLVLMPSLFSRTFLQNLAARENRMESLGIVPWRGWTHWVGDTLSGEQLFRRCSISIHWTLQMLPFHNFINNKMIRENTNSLPKATVETRWWESHQAQYAVKESHSFIYELVKSFTLKEKGIFQKLQLWHVPWSMKFQYCQEWGKEFCWKSNTEPHAY